MKKGWLILTLVLLGKFSFAEENVQVIAVPGSELMPAKDFQNRFRENKKINVAYKTGFGPNVIGNSGLTAGYFINAESLLVLDYMSSHSTRKVESSWFENGTGETNTRDISISYKRFFGESFFVRGGYMHRKLNDTYTGTRNGSVTGTSKFEGESDSAVIAIGNEWQWDNFSLGCEWVGTTVPFKHKINEDTSEGDLGISLFGTNPLFATPESMLKDRGLILVHLTLGASF